MLGKAFFERDAVEVAQDLIGCLLVRRPEGTDGPEIVVRLTETEAYRGSDDPASHAYRGVTPRNAVMFGEAGRLYVYFIYGMHHCINIVTNRTGEPGAVLLRGAEPVRGTEFVRANRPGVPDKLLLNGPGKLAKALGVTMSLNGYDAAANPAGELMVLPPDKILAVRRTGRIGISRGRELPWRFIASSD